MFKRKHTIEPEDDYEEVDMIDYDDTRQAYDDHHQDDDDEESRQTGVGCRQQ